MDAAAVSPATPSLDGRMSDRDQPLHSSSESSLAVTPLGPALEHVVPQPGRAAVSVWIGMLIGLTPTASAALWAAVALAVIVRTRFLLLITAAIAAYASRPLADPWLDRIGGWLLANRGYRPLWLGLMEHPLSMHLQWYNSVTVGVLAAGLIALPLALIADAAGIVLSRRRAERQERTQVEFAPSPRDLGDPPRSEEDRTPFQDLDLDRPRFDGPHPIAAPKLTLRRPSRFAYIEAAAIPDFCEEVTTQPAASMPLQRQVPDLHLAAPPTAGEDAPEAVREDADSLCTELPRLKRKFVVKETIIEILRFHNRRHASNLDLTASPAPEGAACEGTAAAERSLPESHGFRDPAAVPRDVEAAMNVCSRPLAGCEALPFLLSRLSGVHRGKTPEEA